MTTNIDLFVSLAACAQDTEGNWHKNQRHPQLDPIKLKQGARVHRQNCLLAEKKGRKEIKRQYTNFFKELPTYIKFGWSEEKLINHVTHLFKIIDCHDSRIKELEKSLVEENN
jgi:hypothetical protein